MARFSAEVLDHFSSPRNGGRLEKPDARGLLRLAGFWAIYGLSLPSTRWDDRRRQIPNIRMWHSDPRRIGVDDIDHRTVCRRIVVRFGRTTVASFRRPSSRKCFCASLALEQFETDLNKSFGRSATGMNTTLGQCDLKTIADFDASTGSGISSDGVYVPHGMRIVAFESRSYRPCLCPTSKGISFVPSSLRL